MGMTGEGLHFHTRYDAIYVSYLDPVDGQLRLRVYIVEEGGDLSEFRYPAPGCSE